MVRPALPGELPSLPLCGALLFTQHLRIRSMVEPGTRSTGLGTTLRTISLLAPADVGN